MEKVSLQLQWLDQFQFAGYYVAKEKGFYKDVGLDVELRKFKISISPVDEVLSKRSNFAVGRTSLIMNRAKGDKIVLLSAIFQSSPHILLALKDSKINTLQDFKGKKLMLTNDVYDSVAFKAMLTKNHLSFKNLKILPHSFKLTDIINRKTDLQAAYLSNEPFRLQERGIQSKIFDPKDYGFDFYSDFLFTSEDEIINHKQRTINFNQASLKGWRYAFKYINETVDLIFKKYNSQNKTKAALLFEAKTLKKLAYFKTNELGNIDKSKLQRIYDIYNLMEYTTHRIDMDKFMFHEDFYSFTEEEKQYLQKKKVLNICVSPNRMPYEGIDEDGNLKGIIADYFKHFNKKMNLSIKPIQTANLTQTLSFLKEKKCDILPLARPTKKMQNYFNYTKEYCLMQLVIATKPNTLFTADIKELKKQKIGIPKYYNQAFHIHERYPNLNLLEVDNIVDGLQKVVDGELYGHIGTLAGIAYQFQTNFIGELAITAKFDSKTPLSMAVAKGNSSLVSIMNKNINTLSSTTQKTIYNKWVAIQTEKKADYSLFYKLLGFLLFILSVILYRNQKLQDFQKELEQRVKQEVAINREKDQQLIVQSRLAQMGEMISMIAHQWRQPLGAISSITLNLNNKLEHNEFNFQTRQGLHEAKSYLSDRFNQVDDLVQNLSLIIDDFRTFYQVNKEKTSTDFQIIVNKALGIINSSLKHNNITVNTVIKANPTLQLYDNEMMQVILNILKNAEDNFLERKTKNPNINISVDENTLTICDNGGGVPEDIFSQIFNPYFSTKKKKNGTGLGLYMSKMIVQEHHNAKLLVKNTRNGICFTIKMIE